MRKTPSAFIAIAIAAFAVTAMTPSAAQQPPPADTTHGPTPPHTARRHGAPHATGTGRPLHATRRSVPRTALRHERPASNGYDGLWSVSIYTQYGPCDAAYRYPARIYRGRVLPVENEYGYRLDGIVTRNGQISVTVTKGGQSATGYGRLTLSRGGGWWRTAGGQCSGTWIAMRRG